MTEPEGRGFSLASVGRSASFLVGATALVQVVGIMRELFLAAQVGVSPELDAAIVGLALPLVVSTVFVAGARTALVPAYFDADREGDPDRGKRLAGVVMVWVAITGSVAAVLLALGADAAVAVTGPGLDISGKVVAADYVRLTAPILVAMGVSSVLYATCQAEDMFGWIAWSIVTGPLVALITMILLWDDLGLTALAVGSLIGPFVSLVVLVVAVARRHVTPIAGLFGRGLGLRAFWHHALPLTVSAAILQLNTVVDRAVASLVAPGAISALRYGDSLVRAPISAISPAWGAGLYPALVRSTQAQGEDELGPATQRTLRFTIAAFVPIAILAAAVAPVAVAVVFGRGRFGPEDVSRVAEVLAAFAPLIALLMVQPVLVGALNARRQGTMLLVAGIVHVVLNTFFDVVLGFTLGVVGVALSSTFTVALVVLFQAISLRRSGTAIAIPPILRDTGMAALAALPGGLVVAGVCWSGVVPTRSPLRARRARPAGHRRARHVRHRGKTARLRRTSEHRQRDHAVPARAAPGLRSGGRAASRSRRERRA